MHLAITEFHKNPNVGLYLYACDKYCILGIPLEQKKMSLIEKVLNVPVYRMNVCGTSLTGVFLAGNSKTLIVPEIMFDSELAQLDKYGIKYKIIATKQTALGNNILANDKGAIINPEIDNASAKEIEKALGVPVVKAAIAGLDIPGSVAVLHKDKALLHPDSSDADKDLIRKILGIGHISDATVNFGSPYLRSGLVVNANGFVIGSTSSGPEINNVEIELGFLKEKPLGH